MKRLLSFLLVFSLVFTMIPSASAGRIEDPISLKKHAYLSIGGNFDHWEEFTNDSVCNITMVPGERLVTSAFHAIDTSIKHFENLEVVSSDQEVAVAQLTPVGQSSVDGFADSFIGLSIVAKKSGTATITADYDTIDESGINDYRDTPHQTKTFIVTVGNASLDIQLAFSSNEAVIGWPPEKERLHQEYSALHQENAEAYAADIAANLLSWGISEVLNSTLALGTAGLAAGIAALLGIVPVTMVAAPLAAGALLSFAISTAVGLNMNEISDDPNSLEHALRDSTLGVPGILARVQAEQAMREIKEKKIADEMLHAAQMPMIAPDEITLHIRVHNNGTMPATGGEIEFKSENLSFTCSDGPALDSRNVRLPTIAAGDTFETQLPVYPRIAYNNEENSGTPVKVYTGAVTAKCIYYGAQENQRGETNASALLPVYSKLNQQDKEISPGKTKPSAQTRTVAVMCPVDMLIFGADGEKLARLSASGDSFTDGVLWAWVSGETKYLSIPQQALAAYRVELIATDDGMMNIIGSDGGERVNAAFYDQIALTKGETFALELSQSQPVQLYTASQDVNALPMEVTALVNEETIAEALTYTGVSEEKREAIAQAISRGLYPLETFGAFQAEITVQTFCTALLRFYEKRLSLPVGGLTQAYLSCTGETQDENIAVAVSQWAGIFPETEERTENSTHISITTQEANAALTSLMACLGWDANAAVILYPGERVTRETMLATLNRMWNYGDSLEARNEQLLLLSEGVLKSMESIQPEGMDMTIRYLENETAQTPLHNFAFSLSSYEYVFTKEDMLSTVENLIEAALFISQALLPSLGETASTVDIQTLPKRQKNDTLTISTLGAGSFTDSDGAWHLWTPVYYLNKNQSIHDDAVYLMVMTYHDNGGENPPCDVLLIADQEKFRHFLAQMCEMQQACENVTELADIKSKDKGETVLRLQRGLIDLGYLEGEASSVYDSKTIKAVKAFQKNSKLRTSEKATVTTQRVLFGNVEASDIVLEDWLNTEH